MPVDMVKVVRLTRKTTYLPIYNISKTFEENLKSGPNKKFKAKSRAPNKVGDFKLVGVRVNSPFGSAACPTGIDSSYTKVMFDNGYDITTTKTRRSIHFAPHPIPNVVEIEPGKLFPHHNFEKLHSRKITSESEYHNLTIANSFGNNSIAPSHWMLDAAIANRYSLEKPGRLLITSIVGTVQPGFSEVDYFNDFANTALLAKESGARAIEINFSCPNVINEGVLCYDPAAVLAICQLVKQAIGTTPIITKLGYFPQQQQALLEVVVGSIASYVDGVSAINTFAAPVVDDEGNQAMPGKGRLKAGLSGHAIKELGLDMTRRLYDFRERHELSFDIIGVGGVLTPEDFHEYLMAGADAVLSATGAMYNPNLASEIKQSLLVEQ